VLPSEERLRRASVFQRAYNKRMVVSTSVLTMYILPKEGKRGETRTPSEVSGPPAGAGRGNWKPLTGFVVAKKVSKSAVKRNRAKRRIREAYRLLRTSVFNGEREDIALRDWYAIVFVAHEPALAATYQQIEEAVVSCLVRGSSKNRKDRQNPQDRNQQDRSQQDKNQRDRNQLSGNQNDRKQQGSGSPSKQPDRNQRSDSQQRKERAPVPHTGEGFTLRQRTANQPADTGSAPRPASQALPPETES